MAKKSCDKLTCTAKVLVLVGALNWGLVGVLNFNLVETLLGSWPMLVTLVYALVGLSALYRAWQWYSNK